MRLIDADALLDKICKQFDIPDDWDGDIAEPLQTVIDIIDNFDVAYDVESVVAELEKGMKESEKDNALFQIASALGEMRAFEYAIKVVRNGGKE